MDIPELTRKAEAGSCVAQTTVGVYYLFGYDSLLVDYDSNPDWDSSLASLTARAW